MKDCTTVTSLSSSVSAVSVARGDETVKSMSAGMVSGSLGASLEGVGAGAGATSGAMSRDGSAEGAPKAGASASRRPPAQQHPYMRATADGPDVCVKLLLRTHKQHGLEATSATFSSWREI